MKLKISYFLMSVCIHCTDYDYCHCCCDCNDYNHDTHSQARNLHFLLLENSERDHLGPSSLRQTSVKQVAREKRFCHELFLPLLNAKLTPEIIEFIKDEVTRQLNLKVNRGQSVVIEILIHCIWYLACRAHTNQSISLYSHYLY
jgi:hypothetical protein